VSAPGAAVVAGRTARSATCAAALQKADIGQLARFATIGARLSCCGTRRALAGAASTVVTTSAGRLGRTSAGALGRATAAVAMRRSRRGIVATVGATALGCACVTRRVGRSACFTRGAGVAALTGAVAIA